MKFYIFALMLLTAAGHTLIADAATFYLVRHSEKQVTAENKQDPGLTQAGIARAEKTGVILRNIDFTAIYSSDFQRTRATAELIQGSRDTPITIYDPRKLEAFAEQLKNSTADSVILVVGHSNTTPQLAEALSGKPVAPIDESVYHNLYRVGIESDGSSTVEILTVPPISSPTDG